MRATVGILNLVLGVAYSGYGVIAAAEMRRDWRSFGFSRFGAAWVAMAFTCGPHHLVHGIHVLEGPGGTTVELVALLIGLPVGVVWLLLRIEAYRGGAGDRFILGDPLWLRTVPLAAAATTALVVGAALVAAARGSGRLGPAVVTNLVLVVVYTAIGWSVFRTQLRNRPLIQGWSVSGLCLSAIFPTCAVMHGTVASATVAGVSSADWHGLTIDLLSVPAALYFLSVVRRLYRDTLRDWNRGPDVVPLLEVGPGEGAAPAPVPGPPAPVPVHPGRVLDPRRQGVTLVTPGSPPGG